MVDEQAGSDWTILIVDDQYDNVMVAKTVMEFQGAEVHVARNGSEGLELLETIQPTAILLDLSMPIMDGWHMFEEICNRAEMRNVPIIAVTAHAMDRDRIRVLEAGFDDYISKPYDVNLLAERIQIALNRKNKGFTNA